MIYNKLQFSKNLPPAGYAHIPKMKSHLGIDILLHFQGDEIFESR